MSRKTVITGAVVFACLILAGAAFARRMEKTSHDSTVRLGEHLVTIGLCNDCHTPFIMGPAGPEPDMSRMLSGHPEEIGPLAMPPLTPPWTFMGTSTNTAFAGPWGVSYTANLTPDELTGLGIWTEEMFIQALRTGRHMGVSRPIQPPMPWPWFAKMTDRELRSIYAYLRTIPPMSNQVPPYEDPAGQETE